MGWMIVSRSHYICLGATHAYDGGGVYKAPDQTDNIGPKSCPPSVKSLAIYTVGLGRIPVFVWCGRGLLTISHILTRTGNDKEQQQATTKTKRTTESGKSQDRKNKEKTRDQSEVRRDKENAKGQSSTQIKSINQPQSKSHKNHQKKTRKPVKINK